MFGNIAQTLLVALCILHCGKAYDVQIHPEYQQGLAINDVPAERRLHWMRVANEVGSSYGLCSLAVGCVCRWSPMSTSAIRLGYCEHNLGRACVCDFQRSWADGRWVMGYENVIAV